MTTLGEVLVETATNVIWFLVHTHQVSLLLYLNVVMLTYCSLCMLVLLDPSYQLLPEA